MRDIKAVEKAKAALKGDQTSQAVKSFPPGFMVGFRLRTENYQLIIGKGVGRIRDKSVYLKSEYIVQGSDYVASNNIIPGLTYRVYMNASKDVKIDSRSEVWDDSYFAEYHPTLYQYRFLGQFDLGTDDSGHPTYTNIINQNPVLGNDIDADSIYARHLTVGSVGNDALADDAVTSNKIVDAAITSALIAADAIVQAHLSAGSVGTAQLIDAAVTGVKVAVGAITTTKITDNSITTPKLVAGSVTTSIIAAEAVVAAHIATGVLESILLKTGLIYVGFNTNGTGTYDAPEEGDTVVRYSSMAIEFLEYTNGAWSTVNTIKIGGFITGLFIAMIGCYGLYHPNATPSSPEFLPNGNFRVYNFENNYQDQDNIDDWSTKTDLAFSSTTYKFGGFSLFATSGHAGILSSSTGGTQGQSQAMGQWMKTSYSGTGTGSNSHGYFGISIAAGTNGIYVVLRSANGSDELRLTLYVRKGGVTVANYTDICAVPSGWFYCAFVYASSSDKVYVVVNDDIYDMGVMGGSWTGGAWDYVTTRTRNAYVVGGITQDLYVDELLFYWDQYINPDLLAQHYTHGVAWNTELTKADITLIPDTDNGGRTVSDGLLWARREADDLKQMLTWVPIAEPTVGIIASKTSGWTVDRFTAASGGMEVDFSGAVSAGTKAVRCAVLILTASGVNVYSRPAGDSDYASNTPVASTEYYTTIGTGIGTYQAVIRLNADYKAEFAVSSTSVDLYISYPIEELR